MDLALSLPTKAHSWEVVKRVEELGYTHAVAATALASLNARTGRIVFGVSTGFTARRTMGLAQSPSHGSRSM